MKNTIIDVIVVIVLNLCLVHSYPPFMDRVPNGHNVPHPCHSGQTWNGVGHEASGGTGPRNLFGEDFNNPDIGNKQWTTALCTRDSDGDGVSNGVELGDPNCNWTFGSQAEFPSESHPGVCEPVEDPNCNNGWDVCSS